MIKKLALATGRNFLLDMPKEGILSNFHKIEAVIGRPVKVFGSLTKIHPEKNIVIKEITEKNIGQKIVSITRNSERPDNYIFIDENQNELSLIKQESSSYNNYINSD